MKVIRKSLLFLLLFALLLPLIPAALAEDRTDETDDPRFADKTWEEIVEDFLAERNVRGEKVACGWCNTVTGEEHYYNGDQYMVSGSMYKVPMNMIFTERVHNGELSWDTFIGGYRYEYCLHATIVDSNNDIARGMWEYLGGYQPYRHLLAPYMGEDPATVDQKFYENNFSTPRQMIYALNLLATESERFPRLIDEMKQAEPSKYFKVRAHAYEMGHKYGYYTEGNRLYLNDCAIIYTEEPICIVIFTDTVPEPYALLADFCDLMIDYTEYSTPRRREAERLAAEAAAIAALNSPAPEEPTPETPSASAAPQGGSVSPAVPAASAADPKASGEEGFGFGRVLLCVLIGVGALYAFALAAVRGGRRRMKLLWTALAVLLIAAALFVCVLPQSAAMAVKTPATTAADDGHAADAAQQTVRDFFDALLAGEDARACEKLAGVGSLGLETAPESADAALLYAALRDSWDYTLYGDCRVSGDSAIQQAVFTTLDLPRLAEDVKAETEARVEALARELKAEEIYDEDGKYLDTFTARAYDEALGSVLERVSDYETAAGLNLRLVKNGDDWLIEPDSALYSALLGGAKG